MDNQKRSIRNLSIKGKLIVPIVLVLILSLVAVSYIIHYTVETYAVEQNTNYSKDLVKQYQTLRKYYTEQVVLKVKKQSEIKVSYDHYGKEDTIPLPATMIHNLSKMFLDEKNGIQLNLYSAYPFPNRSNRVLDSFQKEAVEYLSKNPDERFSKQEVINGKTMLRVAIADTMNAQACVACHNSHPESPKKDWKLNDVRGVLETSTDMEQTYKSASTVVNRTVFIFIIVSALIIAIIIFISQWFNKRMKITIEALEKVAEGDLTQQIHVEEMDEFGRLHVSFNQTISEMQQTIIGVTTTSHSVSNMSEHLNSGVSEIASQAQTMAANLEETSASMREMNNTVQINANNAQSANQYAMTASQIATRGGEMVSNAMTAMSEINDSSRKIVDIISTIDEIAFQTNLLALNASVEAARAGQEGRGFAVVASEVRNLAQRSSESAKQIKDLINESVTKVDRGTNLVNNSGKVLHEIVVAVKKVCDLVAEMAASSKEQANGIQEINKAINSMEISTQQNAGAADAIADVSKQLDGYAHELLDVIRRFNTGHEVSKKNNSPKTKIKMHTPPSNQPKKPAQMYKAPTLTLGSGDSDFSSFE